MFTHISSMKKNSNTLKIYGLLVTGVLGSFSIENARASDITSIFQAFSSCSGQQLSNALAKQQKNLTNIPLRQQGKYYYFDVPNTDMIGSESSNNLLKFPSNTYTIASLPILAYSQSYSDLLPEIGWRFGRYVYWGFYIQGKVDTVFTQLRPHIQTKENLQIRQKPNEYASSLTDISTITTAFTEWHSQDISSGKIPKPGTVERFLSLYELSDQQKSELSLTGDVTYIYCSIQGSVTDGVLKTEHPQLLSTPHNK